MLDTHLDAIWRFMRRLGVSPDDLEDAFQEVAMIASNRLADIAPRAERAFLFGTAFRVATDYRRRSDGRREVGDETLAYEEDPAPEPDALTDQARARALLERVLAGMTTDLRAVFMLHELDEMTMAEIAELLDIAPGTVASRLRRAREQFEEHVDRLQARMNEAMPPDPGRTRTRKGRAR